MFVIGLLLFLVDAALCGLWAYYGEYGYAVFMGLLALFMAAQLSRS